MGQSIKDYIAETQNSRYELFARLNELGDSDNDEIEKLDTGAELLAEEILSLLIKHRDELEFDFIMEQLSMLGQAPNLLYDDNGNWAVTSTGYQNVVYGDEPEDVETHFFVDAKFWKPTPREALNYYLTYEEDEE